MRREHLQTNRSLLTGRDIHQTQDTTVRSAVRDRHLAKILIQSHENALFDMSAAEDLVIARIFGPVTGPDDVVARGLQWDGRFAPNAGVQKDPHVPVSIVSGSIRSLPTRRRA